MDVEFRRAGERRYAVTVRPERWPAVTMDPAVGFDALLPHDLAHYAVESELGIACGVFGQLALGGDLKTFRRLDGMPDRRLRRRGERLLELHGEELGRSERETAAALRAWKAGDPDALCARLEALSRRWRELGIGGALTLEWPEPSGSHALHGPGGRDRRSARRAGRALRRPLTYVSDPLRASR